LLPRYPTYMSTTKGRGFEDWGEERSSHLEE
jgi:hypothetical protein